MTNCHHLIYGSQRSSLPYYTRAYYDINYNYYIILTPLHPRYTLFATVLFDPYSSRVFLAGSSHSLCQGRGLDVWWEGEGRLGWVGEMRQTEPSRAFLY